MQKLHFHQLFTIAGCLSLFCMTHSAVAQDNGAEEAIAAAEQAQAAAEEARIAAEEAKAAAEKAMAALDAQKAGTSETATSTDKSVSQSEENKWDAVFSHADVGAPNRMVQGIDGGTLIGTHGIQWPYFTRSTIGVSGYIWADASRRKGESTKPDEGVEKQWQYQGRGVLRVSPTYIGPMHFFVQGQIELVADKNMAKSLSAADAGFTDDLWVKLGQWGRKYNNWDFQAGRMEAWPLFNLGMGLDINTMERKGAKVGNSIPPGFYGVTYTWDRPDSDIGNLALHYYPTDWLRVETIFQSGSDTINSLAGRGSAILDFGVVKLKGGAEYKKKTPIKDGNKNDETIRGYGGAIQFVFDPWVEFGGHGAYAMTDIVDRLGADTPASSNDTWSAGGFINVNPLATVGAGKYLTVGAGFNHTNVVDLMEDNDDGGPGEFTHTQGFGAIQYRIFGKFIIKVVIAYAKADIFAANAPEHDTKLISGRLRLQYNF